MIKPPRFDSRGLYAACCLVAFSAAMTFSRSRLASLMICKSSCHCFGSRSFMASPRSQASRFPARPRTSLHCRAACAMSCGRLPR
nr:MAG TPA: hypothetical protein [Caudoviricetes sp.]